MRTLHVLTFCCLFCVGTGAVAQEPGQGPPPDRQRPFERIERLRKVRLIEMLDLGEDQSVRFFARLNEHDQKRREIRRERNEALDRIERLVRNRADSLEFMKAFADVAAIDVRLAAENRAFFDSLRDLLTVEQRGKLLLFERRFESELRDAMREAQRHRRQAEQGP